ncbi:MAG: hypothetical protein JWM85_3527 [Acidimicrobiaceae bacterium]|nr:hypothetical protein [Acidimicrobiaceae bacterium]
MSDDGGMKRIGSVIRLKPGAAEEYERLHASVWPGVLETLRESNVTNYTIFRKGDLLFSYLEYVGSDLIGDMARISADETTKRWWTLTAPLQEPVPDAGEGEWWSDMAPVFHLD